jgi:preprotein translocase subunit SecB
MTPSSAAPKFSFVTQYVKDLSFESPSSPKSFIQPSEQPSVQFGVDVNTVPVSQDLHEVLLFMNVEAKVKDDVVFILELVYAGLFTATGFSDEQLIPLLNIEAPRLLFPFARAIVGNLTREGNFPPLILQPVDFSALYKAKTQKLPTAGDEKPKLEKA